MDGSLLASFAFTDVGGGANYDSETPPAASSRSLGSTATAVGAAGPAEAKKDTVKVEAFDFGFNLPEFEAGKFKLALTNIGQQPHLIAIAEAPEGVTAEEVIADESLIIRDVGFAFALPGETANGKRSRN